MPVARARLVACAGVNEEGAKGGRVRCAAQQRVVGRVSARDNHPLVLCLRIYPSIEGGSARDIAPRLPAGVGTGISMLYVLEDGQK